MEIVALGFISVLAFIGTITVINCLLDASPHRIDEFEEKIKHGKDANNAN